METEFTPVQAAAVCSATLDVLVPVSRFFPGSWSFVLMLHGSAFSNLLSRLAGAVVSTSGNSCILRAASRYWHAVPSLTCCLFVYKTALLLLRSCGTNSCVAVN
ncbi:unnamed protein product, partial [Ectocarpus sp. 6 AP-2014]